VSKPASAAGADTFPRRIPLIGLLSPATAQPLLCGGAVRCRHGAFNARAQLALSDFRNALLASAVLMVVAVLWARRLPGDAGAELSRRLRS